MSSAIKTDDQQEPEEENIFNDSESEDTADEVEDDVQDEEVSDSENYETLEEYCNNPDMRAEIESNLAAVENEATSISIDVKDNNLMLTFRILDSSLIVDGMSEKLAEALEGQDRFRNTAAAFDEELGFEAGTCSVTIRYTDPNDNV